MKVRVKLRLKADDGSTFDTATCFAGCVDEQDARVKAKAAYPHLVLVLSTEAVPTKE
jgi:hypothetical protein